MCFSAVASFGSSVVLTGIGVAAIKKTHHPRQVLFASVPLIFAVQQFAEGILWLALPSPEHIAIQALATYVFLLFAEIIWPIWVPIAILLLEKNATRKVIQKVLVGVGFLVGVYLAYCLLNFKVEARIEGNHITYFQDYPNPFRGYGVIAYAQATIAPPFFSHIKRMWLFGLAILISYIISAVYYEHYMLSVWCFFASIISITIYAIMIEIEGSKRQQL